MVDDRWRTWKNSNLKFRTKTAIRKRPRRSPIFIPERMNPIDAPQCKRSDVKSITGIPDGLKLDKKLLHECLDVRVRRRLINEAAVTVSNVDKAITIMPNLSSREVAVPLR